MTLDYENWLLDEQGRDLLEHHFGWREPTWEDLQEEHWTREDRFQDFSPVAAGLDDNSPRRIRAGRSADSPPGRPARTNFPTGG